MKDIQIKVSVYHSDILVTKILVGKSSHVSDPEFRKMLVKGFHGNEAYVLCFMHYRLKQFLFVFLAEKSVCPLLEFSYAGDAINFQTTIYA